MSEPKSVETYSLALVVVSGPQPTSYSLEATADIAGMHPEMLRHYCRLGVFGDAHARSGNDLRFDDDALYEVRRFEHYRRHHGLNRKTLRLLGDLWREVERLRLEVRFLRGP